MCIGRVESNSNSNEGKIYVVYFQTNIQRHAIFRRRVTDERFKLSKYFSGKYVYHAVCWHFIVCRIRLNFNVKICHMTRSHVFFIYISLNILCSLLISLTHVMDGC